MPKTAGRMTPVPVMGLPGVSRRRCIALGLLMPHLPAGWSQTTRGQSILEPIRFPRDHGAHPRTAIEWWYVTGYLQDEQRQVATAAAAPRYGFQLTFFRARVPDTQSMQSAFAAKQLLFAHAAISDLSRQRLLHDQRIARLSGDARVDLGRYAVDDMALQLADWSLQRDGERYRAEIRSRSFELQLDLKASQPVLLQGDLGWSRKSIQADHASYYYSLPQLGVSASVRLGKDQQSLPGKAWLDHEWSDALLAPDAIGWDWIGINLDDGAALTAFRLRNRAGEAVWAGGSWRSASGALTVFDAKDVLFAPMRRWKSPHSQASYPVQWSVQLLRQEVPAPLRALQVSALIDDQELDSRRSTGTIYWEGLSRLSDLSGKSLGLGYLEMTGYAAPLRLS